MGYAVQRYSHVVHLALFYQCFKNNVSRVAPEIFQQRRWSVLQGAKKAKNVVCKGHFGKFAPTRTQSFLQRGIRCF